MAAEGSCTDAGGWKGADGVGGAEMGGEGRGGRAGWEGGGAKARRDCGIRRTLHTCRYVRLVNGGRGRGQGGDAGRGFGNRWILHGCRHLGLFRVST